MRTENIAADFLAVSSALQAETGNPVLEICAVLDRLPSASFSGVCDGQLVDEVDSVMDELYRRGRLSCPGHRWLSDAVPSIRNHLKVLFDKGHVYRDPGTGGWAWKGVTCLFVINSPLVSLLVWRERQRERGD